MHQRAALLRQQRADLRRAAIATRQMGDDHAVAVGDVEHGVRRQAVHRQALDQPVDLEPGDGNADRGAVRAADGISQLEHARAVGHGRIAADGEIAGGDRRPEEGLAGQQPPRAKTPRSADDLA